MAELYSDANNIELQCVACQRAICFSILDIGPDARLSCQHCHTHYTFNAELLDKIQRFERLITAVYQARDILGSANVGIAFGEEEVKVPYRLLLTRLNTMLTLNIGGKETIFRFRVEPLSIVGHAKE
jgi:hypothetical protein